MTACDIFNPVIISKLYVHESLFGLHWDKVITYNIIYLRLNFAIPKAKNFEIASKIVLDLYVPNIAVT